jgi:uncharacterized protein (DUF2062 family)
MRARKKTVNMLSRTYKQTVFSPIVRFTTRHVLHVDDSPHNIAMGVAIGLFVGCFQMC